MHMGLGFGRDPHPGALPLAAAGPLCAEGRCGSLWDERNL